MWSPVMANREAGERREEGAGEASYLRPGLGSLDGRIAEVFEAEALDEAGVCGAVSAGAAQVRGAWRGGVVAGRAATGQRGGGQAADRGAGCERLHLTAVPLHHSWGRPPGGRGKWYGII